MAEVGFKHIWPQNPCSLTYAILSSSSYKMRILKASIIFDSIYKLFHTIMNLVPPYEEINRWEPRKLREDTKAGNEYWGQQNVQIVQHMLSGWNQY